MQDGQAVQAPTVSAWHVAVSVRAGHAIPPQPGGYVSSLDRVVVRPQLSDCKKKTQRFIAQL